MFDARMVRDLSLLTVAKLAVIAVIYYACFAAFAGRPVDAVSHLLGPPGRTPQFNANQNKEH
jgi:hypothetical protein